MKAALAIIGGFLLSSAIFVSGAVVATWFLAAKPVGQPALRQDDQALWTEQPRAVTPATQNFERVGARPVAADPAPSAKMAEAPSGPETSGSAHLDTTTTASIQPGASIKPRPDDGDAGPEPSGGLSAAHIEWCANRYRSYRPRDNSYTPYSGGRRTCVSPFLDGSNGQAESVSPPPSESDSYGEDAAEPSSASPYESADMGEGASAYLTPEQVNYCFERYQSYRPEDNTYQPYGGGPRRQCR